MWPVEQTAYPLKINLSEPSSELPKPRLGTHPNFQSIVQNILTLHPRM